MTNRLVTSYNPATGEKIWKTAAFNPSEIDEAIKSCRLRFQEWSNLFFEERVLHLESFHEALKDHQHLLQQTISEEVGKPLWESKAEVYAMIHKIKISIEAYQERCKTEIKQVTNAMSWTRHKPHGVVAIFGPYNFPGHLPNGHIVPALLAGNTCLFKPSELASHTAKVTLDIWEKSGLPKGVIEPIYGAKEAGKYLAAHKGIDGLFFTGSYETGHALTKQFIETPEKILALEMGGNNPLVIHDVADIKAAVYMTIQSAFITSGQRCTCARRLILVEGTKSDDFLNELINSMKNIQIGAFNEHREPFMGPLISRQAVEKLLLAQEELIKCGATTLLEMKRLPRKGFFLTPGLIDVTAINSRKDEEHFGPLLQVIKVKNYDMAIQEANQTAYGLAAGLLSDQRHHYEQFYKEIKAGLINWNCPLTGASSNAPFGGIGKSGNYRPSAYYAADYSAYPVASMESKKLSIPSIKPPGLDF